MLYKKKNCNFPIREPFLKADSAIRQVYLDNSLTVGPAESWSCPWVTSFPGQCASSELPHPHLHGYIDILVLYRSFNT